MFQPFTCHKFRHLQLIGHIWKNHNQWYAPKASCDSRDLQYILTFYLKHVLTFMCDLFWHIHIYIYMYIYIYVYIYMYIYIYTCIQYIHTCIQYIHRVYIYNTLYIYILCWHVYLCITFSGFWPGHSTFKILLPSLACLTYILTLCLTVSCISRATIFWHFICYTF